MVMITNSFDKFPNEPTGLMYEQFGKIGLNPATSATYETTFANSTGWTLTNTSGTTWNISSPKLNWRTDIARHGSGAIYDLGSLDSYSTWLLRFELTVDDSFGRNADTLAMFGIHDKSDLTTSINGGYSSSHAQVQIQCAFMDLASNHRKFQAKIANSSSVGQDSSGVNNTLTRDVKYYIEIKKNSATSYTVGYSTNSDYTTGQVSATETITLSGLRYLHFEAWTQSATASYESWGVGWVENLKLYTGVTTASPASPKVKQHFIEWFSGKSLPSYWDKSNTNGTQAMADSIDGGLLMSTTSSGSSISYIDFADKKQFSNTGSVMIAVMKHGSVTGGESYTGLQSGTTQGNGQGAWSYVNDAWKGAVFNLYTVGASGGTWVQTGCVTSDTNWHIHKIELTSSAGSLQIDGNTTVTSTTNLPAVSLQPSVGINNSSAVNRTLSIRYMECYNT